MAKKKSGQPNKSQVIREHLDQNPDAKPKEIVDAHPRLGLTTAFVSTIKSQYLGKGKGKSKKKVARGGRKKTASATAPKARGGRAGDEVSLDALVRMKNLVDQIGSVDEARSALAALEKIQGA